MTLIYRLRQIDGPRTSFTITKGAAFQYAFAFPDQVGPQVPIVAAPAMAAGSPTLSGLPEETVASLVTGQPVAGYGIPQGTTIVGIPSTTSVTLSANATQTGAAVGVTFQPVPLDLTGIYFKQQIRPSASNALVLLEMSTANGFMVNGGSSGVVGAYVPPSALDRLPLADPSRPLVTDIIATASDGGPINLMAQSGPATVSVLAGVTRA